MLGSFVPVRPDDATGVLGTWRGSLVQLFTASFSCRAPFRGRSSECGFSTCAHCWNRSQAGQPFMMQVGRNLTDPLDGFVRGKRLLILDRDQKCTTEFCDLLKHAGTDVVRLPYRSPNLNAYVERFVLSSKSACLERMIFFGEQSLRRAVSEFTHHYHGERNHQGLGNALIEAEECVGSPTEGAMS